MAHHFDRWRRAIRRARGGLLPALRAVPLRGAEQRARPGRGISAASTRTVVTSRQALAQLPVLRKIG